MKASPAVLLCLAVAFILASLQADAALLSRLGGRAYYDDVLNITWLADANYAKTSGYDLDGSMTWGEAKNWAATLEIQGVTGWHLPILTPSNDVTFNYDWLANGSDYGYNTASTHSPLGYMYFHNLSLKALFSPSGAYQADFGATGLGYAGEGRQADVGPVKNLQQWAYWYATDYEVPGFPSVDTLAWVFNANAGAQGDYRKVGNAASEPLPFSWAVHDGDVGASPVPLPCAAFLIAPVLGCLCLARRRAS